MIGRVRALILSIAAGLALLVLAAPANATFPGTNGRIAFATGDLFPPELEDVHSQVFTIGQRGNGLRQLTHVAGDQAASTPDWSPNGQRIAYTSNVSGAYEIWVMNANGSGQTQLTHRSGFEDFLPSWSPDGNHIVFSRCGEPLGFISFCEIDVMNANGTGVHKLVGGRRFDLDAAYSPNGKKIAFGSDRAGFKGAVWVVNANGSSLRRLTPPRLEAFVPDWSPDGRRIVFTDHCCAPGSNVWTMRANGTGFKQLTHLNPPSIQAGFAGYSPNGQRIVFSSNRKCRNPDAFSCRDFHIMHTDGSHVHRVVTGVPNTFLVDWGPGS